MADAPRPIAADNCTVNGTRVRASDAAWLGLDFARAELCETSIWGADHHLNVPWCHSDDPRTPENEAHYRVRPHRSAHRFWREGGVWMVGVPRG